MKVWNTWAKQKPLEICGGRDFPGSPGVKTLTFHAVDMGSALVRKLRSYVWHSVVNK